MDLKHIGNYRIVRQIGLGGMGAVYEAQSEIHGGIVVAIKVLQHKHTQDRDLVTRFLNEARAASAIQHPGIVKVIESGQLSDGTAYIVMELLEGESLSARLKRHGGKLGLWGVWVIRGAAAALSATHSQRIIHRDLKPSNLMLVRDAKTGVEQVKVIDFGIAKIPAEQQTDVEFHTRTGAMIGTPVYMSPEQCRGVAVTDRTDVYSLGVLLFHVLCGRPPFFSPADGDMLAMHILVPPPVVRNLAPEVPQELSDLTARMLAKSPEDRPSMAEVAEALAPYCEGASIDPDTQAEITQESTRVGPLQERATAALDPKTMTHSSDAVTGQVLLPRSGSVGILLRRSGVPPMALALVLGIVGLSILGALWVRARTPSGVESAAVPAQRPPAKPPQADPKNPQEAPESPASPEAAPVGTPQEKRSQRSKIGRSHKSKPSDPNKATHVVDFKKL